jgi:hypothetical protein
MELVADVGHVESPFDFFEIVFGDNANLDAR